MKQNGLVFMFNQFQFLVNLQGPKWKSNWIVFCLVVSQSFNNIPIDYLLSWLDPPILSTRSDKHWCLRAGVTSLTKDQFTAVFALDTLIKIKASDRSKSCSLLALQLTTWRVLWQRLPSYNALNILSGHCLYEFYRKRRGLDHKIFCFLQYLFPGASLYTRLPCLL